MDLAILLIRTLVLYFLLMLTLQLLFRRRKTTLADLLVAFMIAQFAVLAVDRPEKPLLALLLPTLLLLVLHQLFKPVFNKKEETPNPKIPSIQLRPQKADVEMGLLETVAPSGPIGPLPLPLILDGRVLDHNLEQLGKTRFWLKNEVQRYGVRRFKEVAYCSMDRYGHMFLDKKKL
ncbi:YetF domain-containing protein [Ammoniphilus sp. YIM 78166]|uniref:YetF domain-containing protein n=1 Tax=Ammoniphilus sp. YIM 78166 TaxID=1644106 RepID=UPI00106FF5B8|nr:YetF domain-containing protein [Ammoniphilus sp. YIM 78166]